MRLRTIATRTLTYAALAVAASLVVGQLLGHPVGLGYVTSDSMAPTLSPGDGFVAVPPALAGPVGEGDVVVFRAETLDGGGLVTHRVVGRTAGGFVTQGDANPLPDQVRRGEPPVSRDRVVATALQVDGEVVVVPHLGTAVAGVRNGLRAVRAAAAAATGVPALRRAVGLGVLLVSLVAYAGVVAAEWLRGGRTDRRDRGGARARPRPGTDPRLVVAVLGVALLAGATAAVVVPSGTHEFALVAADDPARRPDAVATGGETGWNLTLRNGGLLPAAVFLEPADDGATVRPRRVSVPPRGAATAAVTVRAPEREGPFTRRVVVRQYPLVLPPDAIGALYAVHPWAPLVAIDALVAGLFVAATAPLVGRGRLRSRPDRPTGGPLAGLWRRLLQ